MYNSNNVYHIWEKLVFVHYRIIQWSFFALHYPYFPIYYINKEAEIWASVRIILYFSFVGTRCQTGAAWRGVPSIYLIYIYIYWKQLSRVAILLHYGPVYYYNVICFILHPKIQAYKYSKYKPTHEGSPQSSERSLILYDTIILFKILYYIRL